MPTQHNARADAYVYANAAFGEEPAVAREDRGLTHARVDLSATDEYTGATGQAYGEVSGFPLSTTLVAPSLHATASGHSTGDNGDYAGQSGVSASWSDNLRYNDAQIADPEFFLTTSIYFVGHYDGSISGLTGGRLGGSFSASVSRYDAQGNVVTYNREFDFDHAGSYNETFRLKLPANALVPDTDTQGNPLYARFTLDLALLGGGHYDDFGFYLGDITSDFGSTAALDTIYIGDDAGNPLPQYDYLKVIGDQGGYAMGAPTTVPEPGTWSLLAVGACLGLLALRRRRRQA